MAGWGGEERGKAYTAKITFVYSGNISEGQKIGMLLNEHGPCCLATEIE